MRRQQDSANVCISCARIEVVSEARKCIGEAT